MSARYEFWLSGPVSEAPAIGPYINRPIEPEEMLKRLVLALRGAGYTVRSYSYECVIDQVETEEQTIVRGLDALTPRQREVIAEEIERRSHLVPTVEVTAAEQPQGETHE